MLSYHEWERCQQQQQIQCDNVAVAVAEAMEQEENAPEPERLIKAIDNKDCNEKIKTLCRVCNSNGLISINATINQFKIKLVGERRHWEVSIGKIIEAISGESVSCNLKLYYVNVGH